MTPNKMSPIQISYSLLKSTILLNLARILSTKYHLTKFYPLEEKETINRSRSCTEARLLDIVDLWSFSSVSWWQETEFAVTSMYIDVSESFALFFWSYFLQIVD
ncbi:hypothetical protein Ancab_031040 [Ancistrocladus abbreviatus]